MRMQGALGSLAGYTSSRIKIYDSHVQSGEYSSYSLANGIGDDYDDYDSSSTTTTTTTNNVISEAQSGSSLEVTADGVFITNSNGQVTFQIVVPPKVKVRGTIQGFLWNDSGTNDGIFGAGDTAVSGVDVVLLDCTSLDEDRVVRNVTSGNDGTFVMEGLMIGRYKVHVVTPPPPSSSSSSSSSSGGGGSGAGYYTFVAQNVNEGNDGAALGQDSDVNADGFSDCLVLNDDSGDNNGGLLNYLVYVGMMDGGGGGSINDDDDAAKKGPMSVGGRVFYDENGDGLLGGGSTTAATSTPVGNIIVDLYDCVNPDQWITVTRTDASGNYEFTVTDPSSATTTTTDLTSLLEQEGITQFRAVFSGLPNGYTFSPKSVDSDVTSVDGSTACYDVEGNGDTTAIIWNAGIQPPQTGKPTMKPTMKATTLAPAAAAAELVTIGGYAFLDLNNDGTRSPNFDEEVAIPDINVRLFAGCGNSDDDGTFFSAARTDAQGLYKFVNVPSGSYKMVATAPEGFEFSSIWTDMNANADSKFNPETGKCNCFALQGGNTDLSWGVGLRDTAPVVISGVVFDDANNNGFFDSGETPMSDVNVALFDCDGSIKMLDNTDDNGMYGFSDLTAGSYLLKFSAPQGYQISSTWSGFIDEEGKLMAPNADSNVNPDTASSVCKSYKAGEEEYSLDAGMSSSVAATTPADSAGATAAKPTSKPSNDPKGDGTPCSGSRCDVEGGMCRNKAGLCGLGLAFCNANSVWTKNCHEDDVPPAAEDTSTASPTTSLRPTAKPTLSSAPTISPNPTTISNDATAPFCHIDGSVGDVSGSAVSVQFTYSIESEAFSPSSTATLIDLFEKELNRHVACDFADHSCLICDTAAKSRAVRSTKNATMIGLSPYPKDEITLRPCAIPSSKCKIMKGVMTSYYPQGTSASVLESEQKQLLDSIDSAINIEDWIGMKVSLVNTIPELKDKTKPESPPSSGGLSGGAIAGLLIAILSIFAVVALGIVRIRRIRDKEDEEYFAQMQEKSSIPFGNADLNGDDDDSDDSSDDSDEDSSSHPSRSAISGETFLTNIAQAMPQDIENSESSSESGSSESEDEMEHGADEETDVVEMNQEGIDHMKYSTGSDDAPPIYENFDRMDSEEIAAAAGYDDDSRHQAYPYSTMASRRVVVDDVGADDATATESVNSADPPGQSYRDLPEDWEPALPPSAMYYGPGGERFSSGEDVPVYEHDLSGSESGEESNQGSYRSGRSNRSYHSNRSHRSNRSNHSGSQRSNRSYQSRHSHGSHHSGRSNGGSHYSRHSNPDQQEQEAPYNQSEHNDSYQSQHSYHSNHSGSGSDRSYHEDYDQFGAGDQQFVIEQQQQQHGNPNSFPQPQPQPRYDDQQYMSEQDQAYASANMQQQGRFNENEARYDGGVSSPQEAAYHGGGGEFDEASYHSSQSPPSHQYQPEVFDDPVDDVSTYTSATRKASNVSNHEGQGDYEGDDDEESISEIFKSLSAIQTRLASKGKPGGKDNRSRSNNKGMPSHAAPQSPQQQGWDQEGLVEDVSVDGSQISSMASNHLRNHRPQKGQWMEPVDEQED